MKPGGAKSKPAFPSRDLLEKAGSGKRRKVFLLVHDSGQQPSKQFESYIQYIIASNQKSAGGLCLIFCTITLCTALAWNGAV